MSFTLINRRQTGESVVNPCAFWSTSLWFFFKETCTLTCWSCRRNICMFNIIWNRVYNCCNDFCSWRDGVCVWCGVITPQVTLCWRVALPVLGRLRSAENTSSPPQNEPYLCCQATAAAGNGDCPGGSDTSQRTCAVPAGGWLRRPITGLLHGGEPGRLFAAVEGGAR